ncbi:unnamed protein product [Adineta steineri]|uniref:Uncharacterized protein n=1 Tax=Adineta steineri TaxID=433720 RepID=A0A815EQ15_9BILA|nr:unnamed protein product [Adineta steineri]CAF1309377.1 unnamed protein product [Adineta steineri]
MGVGVGSLLVRILNSINSDILISGKHENEIWLESNNSPDESPVSYYATRHDATKSITQTAYDLTKHRRFAHGRGIHSTSDINTAKLYAPAFTYNRKKILYCASESSQSKGFNKN